MNNNDISIKIENLSCDLVNKLINTLDEQFAKHLQQVVNLDDYSIKLSNNASFVVVVCDGEYVGMIAYYFNENKREFYIPYLCVRSSHRKLGVADLMMNKICFEADKKGYNISLEVRKDNVSAIKLYEKHGFKARHGSDIKISMIRNSRC